MATTANEPEDFAGRLLASLQAQDRAAFRAVNSADIVLHHPRETYRGIDDVVEFQWDVFDAFSDPTFTLEDVVAGDDLVAVRYSMAGVHDGEFGSIPPTGTAVEMQAMAMMRVDDGAIRETWLRPDRLGLLRQLGVVEAHEP